MDARRLLGTLIEAGMSPSTQKRITSALGSSGLGGTAAKGGAGGGLTAGIPLGAGGLGAIAGAMLGGRKGGTLQGAIGGGAVAILGKLAYDAFQQRAQAGGTTTAAATPTSLPAAAGTSWTPVPGGGWAAPTPAPAEEEAGARLLLQAMLAAAKADGHIDGGEMQRIMAKLDEAGADADDKAFLMDEMRKPSDVADLARQATAPETAAQVYAASLLAIEVDTDAERDYLRRLASALRLDEATVGRLHASVGAAR